MKIYDVYKEQKNRYKKYVVLIKVGNFYETYGEDAYILNNLFDYKIKDVGGVKRVGFPLIAFNKVESKLSRFKINYVFYENNSKTKHKFNINNYDKFATNSDSIMVRIDKICEKLKVLQESPKVEKVLNKIEEIL